MKCNAGWYELNISAPDNRVSACCYYSGPCDPWLDKAQSLDAYWNSENFQLLRRANIDSLDQNGCTGCHYFRHKTPEAQYFPGLPKIDNRASSLQQANWRLALQEFESNREVVRAKPLRYYVNFGFACNISCIQCHQVPRRKTNGRQVRADVLCQWRNDFKSALEVGVIGGEPFALVEALKFIRAFIEDEELADVRLCIYTNGTLHHRHMDLLKKKRKLSLIVSLDSMGDAYDYIRVDSSWALVEKNLLNFVETGKQLNLDWRASTSCGLMKTGIPKLPQFAEWSVRHDIEPWYFEIISAPGVEKAVADENVLANPWLVRQIPGWKDYFTQAAEIYRKSRFANVAGSMEFFRGLIEERLAALIAAESTWKSEVREGWSVIFDEQASGLAKMERNLYGKVKEPPLRWQGKEYLMFRRTDLNDHLSTKFTNLPRRTSEDLCVRITWWWPAGVAEADRCVVHLQDQSFASKWNIDIEQTTPDGESQRHLVLGKNSKQFRIVFYAGSREEVVLPTRVKIELRPHRAEVALSPQPELVQIS